MRLLLNLLCVLLLLLLAPCSVLAVDADPHAADRHALFKLFRSIVPSNNAQHVDRMATQMHPQATVTWFKGEVSPGHD